MKGPIKGWDMRHLQEFILEHSVKCGGARSPHGGSRLPAFGYKRVLSSELVKRVLGVLNNVFKQTRLLA